jgi:hypothetical protein
VGISESTVKLAITSLEEKRFIKTVRRRGQVNRYRIDQLEGNPYLVLSENVHFFLKLYQPKYIKKTLIQSVIATVINGDSYTSYANKLYEAYHSNQPYPDIAYETILEMLDEIRQKLGWRDCGYSRKSFRKKHGKCSNGFSPYYRNGQSHSRRVGWA